jgi:serine protease inhibitor
MTASAAEVMLMIDRPFYFLVRDADTGAIIFLGQVTDPRG